MRVTEVVLVGPEDAPREVLVRELTVAEMRNAIKSRVPDEQAGVDPDVIGLLLSEEMTFTDMANMSDLQPADFDDLTQSDLRAVRQKIRELNADFFGMLGRLQPLLAGVLRTTGRES